MSLEMVKLMSLLMSLVPRVCSYTPQQRYDMAIQLLRSGRRCPWSVELRRGSPSSTNYSSSGIFANSSSSHGSSTGEAPAGSATRKDWTAAVNESTAVQSANGPQAVTIRLSQLRVLLEAAVRQSPWQALPAAAAAVERAGDSAAAAAVRTTASQVWPVCSPTWQQQQQLAPGSPQSDEENNILLLERVMAGYIWRLELAAVRCDSSNSKPPASNCCVVWQQQQQQRHQLVSSSHTMLCLSISCKPAWAAALAAADGSSVKPTSSSLAAAAAAASHNACSTCNAFKGIASAKAAEAITRHAPIASLPSSFELSRDAPLSCSSSSSKEHGPMDVVVGVQLLAASSMEELEHLVKRNSGSQQHPAASYMPCLLHWDQAAAAGEGLLPINIQHIAKGTNLLSATGVSCCSLDEVRPFNGTEAAVEAQRPEQLEPTPTAAAGTASVAANVAIPAGLCLQGWQPAVWSGLAPGGNLYWHVGLRQLLD